MPKKIPSDLEILKRRLREVFGRHHPDDAAILLQGRYTGALAAVAAFLDRTDEGVGAPFWDLAVAIAGLRFGVIAKSLRPAKCGGRGPDGLRVWSLRAGVVTGLECILKSQNMKRRDAAEYVARKYPIFK